MVRPPPLQLRLDNWYPELVARPSTGIQSPSKSLIDRFYNRSWRAPVILVAVFNVVRYLGCAISAFSDFHVDKSLNASELAILSFVTGIIYIALFIVELFGSVTNALPRRLHLIETYSRMVYISAILVSIAGLIYTSSYFVYENELVAECAYQITHGGPKRSTFHSKAWPTSISDQKPTAQDASQECYSAWSSNLPTQILSFPLTFLLPTLLQLLIVYTYHRQCTDPRHPSNLCHQYQHRSTRRSSYQPLPRSSNSQSSGSSSHTAGLDASERGWFHFPPTRRSPFSRFRSITRQISPIKGVKSIQRYGRTDDKAHMQNGGKNKTKIKQNQGKRVPPLLTIEEVASPLASSEVLSPGLPSFGGGRGQDNWRFYNGRLSAFTIGSIGTGDDEAFD